MPIKCSLFKKIDPPMNQSREESRMNEYKMNKTFLGYFPKNLCKGKLFVNINSNIYYIFYHHLSFS